MVFASQAENSLSGVFYEENRNIYEKMFYLTYHHFIISIFYDGSRISLNFPTLFKPFYPSL